MYIEETPKMSPGASDGVKDEMGRTCRRQDRPKLTEQEKNRNHLNSEHKRRTNIRTSMEQICELVPGLQGKAAAEGEVLERAIQVVKEQLERNKMLCEERDRLGLPVPDHMRMYDGATGLPPGKNPPERPNGDFTEWLREAGDVLNPGLIAGPSHPRIENNSNQYRLSGSSSISSNAAMESPPAYEDVEKSSSPSQQ